MIKKLMFIAWIGLIGVGFGCDGPQGEVGPAGPKGDPGAAGEKGEPGEAGADGMGAKEILTGAVTTTKGGYTLGKANLTAADTAMINKSAIVVFIKSQGFWWAQPGVVRFADNKSTNYHFVTLLRGNTIFVDIRPLSWSEDQEAAPERQFEAIRAVFIPADKLRQSAEVDWTNYKQAMAALGLKE
ncbi:hypothetical protein DYBT9623_02702 [Dyadobacter sp. CECT 9623]|jgi:hypothetical protein|uniref:Collagen-like protein n=1 Tax=Dyadobacter linearis TaxID=2823330 RepID=A0ABM8UR14_9BACT|nr:MULTISPECIES: collagen-like protein [unclassified Dyadobacter]MCE7058567.1 collagen-like protein [Dyadobacter sp. CY343]CAG5069962.1 hypothetical protein DYBT9623_02702 [Dyadobacter sp. CECT 9623]